MTLHGSSVTAAVTSMDDAQIHGATSVQAASIFGVLGTFQVMGLLAATDHTGQVRDAQSEPPPEPSWISAAVGAFGMTEGSLPTSHARVVQMSAALAPAMEVASQIAELRRLSGLSWPDIARLFSVGLDEIDAWESGAPIPDSQQLRLESDLRFVRRIWRGSAQDTREWMFTLDRGVTPFDRMRCDQTELVTLPKSMELPPLREIDAAVLEAQAPPDPELLIDAMHDPVHLEPSSPKRFFPLRKPR